jgi:threonine synthase
VPTGNFGNVFAGYVAAQMGLPIERLIVASNQNDILTRFFESGTMQREAVAPSYSPSMDIQVSSNFERLLFELLGRDGNAVNAAMATFAKTGRFDVDAVGAGKRHIICSQATGLMMRQRLPKYAKVQRLMTWYLIHIVR